MSSPVCVDANLVLKLVLTEADSVQAEALDSPHLFTLKRWGLAFLGEMGYYLGRVA